jgi:two-component system, OmpR family, phosphate regulon sensor histidine kinase PhoR
MHGSLKKILVRAVAASAGLIILQAWWITHEWKAASEIVRRQVDHAVQEAVLLELEERKDTLRQYLKALLKDTTLVRFSAFYNKQLGTWTIKMADASNPADFTNFSNKKIPVDSVISESQKEKIVHHLVTSAVEDDVGRNAIMYYTQHFGNSWNNWFDSLKLNSDRLHTLLKQKLAAAGIAKPFSLKFTDTSATTTRPSPGKSYILSAPAGVQFNSVWDYDHRYMVQAEVKNPYLVLLQKLWLAIVASFLLVLLTIYFIFRMVRIIRNQKQLDEIKNDFIDNMTHELKTPLSVIRAAIDSLQYYQGLRDENRTTRYLNTSRNELVKLDEMVSRLLDISLYEKQSSDLRKGKIALFPLIEEIVAALRIQYNRSFEFTIKTLPDDFQVYADKTHFTNILRNLLENALKHVPGVLKINISATRESDFDIIALQDSGPGIPVSSQPFLFDKFYRVPSNNIHNSKGYGLGLYYVKQMVLAHGGEISVMSKPGNGTTFKIKLPVNSND